MIPFPPGSTGAPRPSVDTFRRPAHPNKHVRRTATTVCGGYFDYSPPVPAQRRVAPPQSSVLAGVENVAWARAGRDPQLEKLSKFVSGPSRVTPSGGAQVSTHSTHAAARSALHFSTSAPNSHQLASLYSSGDVGESYSGDEFDAGDEFDPVGPIVSSPRPMSEASSILSYASSHRPLTPFEEGASPTTTVSPGGYRDDFEHYATYKGSFSGTEAAHLPKFQPSHGLVRPRSDSGNVEEVPPAKKKRPVGRPPKKKRGIPAAPSTQITPGLFSVLPPPQYIEGAQDDEDDVIRDCLGRARPLRRKSASRKGWKGWIEVDETVGPPTTLIKLDEPAVIEPERRTRSGRNFDG